VQCSGYSANVESVGLRYDVFHHWFGLERCAFCAAVRVSFSSQVNLFVSSSRITMAVS